MCEVMKRGVVIVLAIHFFIVGAAVALIQNSGRGNLDDFAAPRTVSTVNAPNCGSTMNSLQTDVWSTLSWTNTMRLDAVPCGTQRKVLDILANVPREYRNEQLDRMFDAAHR